MDAVSTGAGQRSAAAASGPRQRLAAAVAVRGSGPRQRSAAAVRGSGQRSAAAASGQRQRSAAAAAVSRNSGSLSRTHAYLIGIGMNPPRRARVDRRCCVVVRIAQVRTRCRDTVSLPSTLAGVPQAACPRLRRPPCRDVRPQRAARGRTRTSVHQGCARRSSRHPRANDPRRVDAIVHRDAAADRGAYHPIGIAWHLLSITS